MNMEFIKKIESNIKELEDRANRNREFIANANTSIERLTSEKMTISDEINRIVGALEAFKFVLKEQEVKCESVECVSQEEVKAE